MVDAAVAAGCGGNCNRRWLHADRSYQHHFDRCVGCFARSHHRSPLTALGASQRAVRHRRHDGVGRRRNDHGATGVFVFDPMAIRRRLDAAPSARDFTRQGNEVEFDPKPAHDRSDAWLDDSSPASGRGLWDVAIRASKPRRNLGSAGIERRVANDFGDPADLANEIVREKQQLAETGHRFAEGDPRATMTIDARWDDMTYFVVIPAAQRVALNDPIAQHRTIAELNQKIIRQWPERYAIWLLKSARRGAWAIAADMVMHPIFLIAIVLAMAYVLYRSVTVSYESSSRCHSHRCRRWRS